MQTQKQRIVELDSLRGLAALAVVAFHYTTRYDQLFGRSQPLPFEAPWGGYGVDFFFILSGLMILRSLDRAPSAIQFVAGRFARLYPAYWAAAALTFAGVAFFGLPGQEVSIREALLNLSMVQQLLGARHIDGAYWSLQVELLFYGVALALHRAGAFRTDRRLYGTVACWLVLAAIYHGGVADGFGLGPIATGIVCKAAKLCSLQYAHLFALGILLYRADRKGGQPWAALLLAVCSCAIQGLVDCWAAAVFVAAAAATILAATNGRLGWLRARGLAFLGTISYPLYLIHENIGYIVIREFERRWPSPTLAILAAVGVSFALAAGLAFAVERPGRRWLMSRIGPVCRACGWPRPEAPLSPAPSPLTMR